MNETYEVVQDRIKKNVNALREYYGFNIPKLAEKLGYKKSNIYYLIGDERKFNSLEVLCKLAEIFEVTPGDLMGRDFEALTMKANSRLSEAKSKSLKEVLKED